MTVEGAGALALLALTDSLSFGTLLIPVWLLMTPGTLRPQRVLAYLAMVAAAYAALGVALVTGGQLLFETMGDTLDSTPALMARLTVGVSLLALSFLLDTQTARARAAQRAPGGRVQRWRERAMSDSRSIGPLAGLAIAAVAAEAASMLPYIAATGIISAQTSGWAEALPSLAAYCLVMIAPALALMAGRIVAHSLIEQPLSRLDTWLTANARSTTLWIVGIAGFFLATTAINDLGWFTS